MPICGAKADFAARRLILWHEANLAAQRPILQHEG
jgi:hypothetical protein